MTVVQASQEEIRVAYKRLALVWHPDRNPHCDRRVAQDKFQAIQQAYSVLSRPERRQAYHLECLDCWDMKEYLSNFRDLVLTLSGLGLQPYSRSGQEVFLFYEDEPTAWLQQHNHSELYVGLWWSVPTIIEALGSLSRW
ncbi:hypothetical protein WJX82_010907 [Trebouxia sp. C0006]